MFIIPCILLGLAYAYLLYKKPGPWGPNISKLLFGLRFLLASMLAALLVSPILKQIQNIIEPPSYVIAIDNSSSIGKVADPTARENLLDRVKQFANSLSEDGVDVQYRTISGETYETPPDSISYTHAFSDLSAFLNDVAFDYEGRNLQGVTLISDGIYNQGIAPTFKTYNFDLNVIGVGDTVPKSDIKISTLVYNKISYQGNKFPLVVQFNQQGYSGESTQITITREGAIIDSRVVQLGRANQVQEERFLIEAKEKGFQRYSVTISPRPNEFTTLNNTQQAYIEVIEGKENIALIASAPHPNIKAIRAGIESNANYTFDQYIMSLRADQERLINNNKKYDLVILHQLPDRRGYFDQYVQGNLKANTPILTLYGADTDINKFNLQNGVLKIDAVPGEYDEVTASFNQSFTFFKFSEELQETLPELPPITVPFGKFALEEGSRTLLYQQVGNIVTSKPLIAINNQGTSKHAVIMGSDLWKWRLTSYVINESHSVFNELISKLVQFLSSKEDKRKFKVYPIKNEFTTNEAVVFDSEVYNDLYERIYGNKITLNLTDEEGENFSYDFITSENNTRYRITGLSEGVYKYTAYTMLQGEQVRVSGEFVLKELKVEDLNHTADFKKLKTLATQNNGEFYKFENGQFTGEINTVEATGVIHTSEKYLPFINLPWLFFLLLLIISTEWFIRKYSGSY
ncbi:MAG: hypothetical protein R3345_05765 [Fulvivirga sp.]|nr:hypothetical protein [Fulvivirga sp.]